MTAQIQTIQLTLKTTTAILKVVRETPKAILVAGKMSEAWFPKAVIKDGVVRDTFKMTLLHWFLFECPWEK
jgi:hypothetical protein